MVILGGAYVFFKKLVSLVSAIMLLIVGASEKDLPQPDGAEIIGRYRYVHTDYNITSQGVTNDGEYFYFSANKNIGKADMETGEIFRVNLSAIPEELKEKDCDHIGCLSYHNGNIYAAIEGGEYLNNYIVLYDAQTLEYTGIYYELPYELHEDGVPWCAIDAERGYLYTAEWEHTAELNVFNLSDMSFVKTVAFSQVVERIQGCEMFGDKLYMSTDVGDEKTVYSLDVETGLVETAFVRNVGEAFEAEGMTVCADENGEAVFCVLDRGEERFSCNLTFYKLTK